MGQELSRHCLLVIMGSRTPCAVCRKRYNWSGGTQKQKSSCLCAFMAREIEGRFMWCGMLFVCLFSKKRWFGGPYPKPLRSTGRIQFFGPKNESWFLAGAEKTVKNVGKTDRTKIKVYWEDPAEQAFSLDCTEKG